MGFNLKWRSFLQFRANLKSVSHSTVSRGVPVLDEESFRRYPKKIGKSEKRCKYEVHTVRRFEEYLSRHKSKKLGAEIPVDLADFVDWAKREKRKGQRTRHGLAVCTRPVL